MIGSNRLELSPSSERGKGVFDVDEDDDGRWEARDDREYLASASQSISVVTGACVLEVLGRDSVGGNSSCNRS